MIIPSVNNGLEVFVQKATSSWYIDLNYPGGPINASFMRINGARVNYPQFLARDVYGSQTVPALHDFAINYYGSNDPAEAMFVAFLSLVDYIVFMPLLAFCIWVVIRL